MGAKLHACRISFILHGCVWIFNTAAVVIAVFHPINPAKRSSPTALSQSMQTELYCPATMDDVCTQRQAKTGAIFVCYKACTRSKHFRHKIPVRLCLAETEETCDYCKCKDKRYLDIDTEECLTKRECIHRPKYALDDYDSADDDRGYVRKSLLSADQPGKYLVKTSSNSHPG